MNSLFLQRVAFDARTRLLWCPSQWAKVQSVDLCVARHAAGLGMLNIERKCHASKLPRVFLIAPRCWCCSAGWRFYAAGYYGRIFLALESIWLRRTLWGLSFCCSVSSMAHTGCKSWHTSPSHVTRYDPLGILASDKKRRNDDSTYCPDDAIPYSVHTLYCPSLEGVCLSRASKRRILHVHTFLVMVANE